MSTGKTIMSPAHEGVDPYLVIGALMHELDTEGVITVDAWNRAVKLAKGEAK